MIFEYLLDSALDQERSTLCIDSSQGYHLVAYQVPPGFPQFMKRSVAKINAAWQKACLSYLIAESLHWHMQARAMPAPT